MTNDLPNTEHFENFFIWFDDNEKKEYYSTPLYYYKATFNIDYENNIRTIKWKEKEGTDQGLKHPSSLYLPFCERLGMFVLNFLNADLSSYETAYKDFFYMYGFEILKDIDGDYKFELKNRYGNDTTYLQETEKIYNNLKVQIIDIQENIRKAVDYIYNINENEELKGFTHTQRYAVYLIKRMGKLYFYSKNDKVILDNYSNKYNELNHFSEIELLTKLKEQNMLISMSNTHQSNDISSICYAIIEELSKVDNYPIKKCQNCGKYFIPIKKTDEIYCDYPKPSGKTCREQGASILYNKRLQENSAYSEYRKMYLQKFNYAKRNKENMTIQKDFENWKKEAKDIFNKLKKNQVSEDEVYKWLSGSK